MSGLHCVRRCCCCTKSEPVPFESKGGLKWFPGSIRSPCFSLCAQTLFPCDLEGFLDLFQTLHHSQYIGIGIYIYIYYCYFFISAFTINIEVKIILIVIIILKRILIIKINNNNN